MPVSTQIAVINAALTHAFDQLAAWFEAPAAVRAHRPAQGGWTIDEILEHVGLTNHYLLILIEKAADKALRNPHGLDLATELARPGADAARLQAIGQHRSFAWVRPAHMEPTGTTPPAEVAALLREQLHRCQLVLARLPNGEGVLHRTTMSVNELGKLDVYELVHFLAQHAARHLTQIERAAAEVA